MWKLTLAQMRSSASRLVAAGIAILLGTGFVTATLLASGAMKQTTYNSVTSQYAGADLVIEGSGLKAQTLEKVRSDPQVAAADPLISTGAEFSTTAGSEYGSIISTGSSPQLQRTKVVQGNQPTTDSQVALAPTTAKRLGAHIGSEVTLSVDYWVEDDSSDEGGEFAHKTSKLKVVGILAEQQAVFSMPTAAMVTQSKAMAINEQMNPGDAGDQIGYGSVIAALNSGTDQGSAISALESELGPNVSVRTVSDVAEEITSETTGSQVTLLAVMLAFAAIALIVAALVIANTFAVLIAQRTHTLALLRCVGASKKQVRSTVLIEAGILGAVSSIVGILAGSGIVAAALAIIGHQYPDVPLATGIAFTPAVVIAPLITGVVVTVVAALFPARLATKVAPLEALRPMTAPGGAAVSKWRIAFAFVAVIVGAAMLAGGYALSAGSNDDGSGLLLGLGVGILGGLVSLFGLLLACATIVPGLIKLFGKVFGRSAAAKIAVANSVRNPRRSGATASALVIGVALVAMMSTGAMTASKALGSQLDSSFPVDLTLSSSQGLNASQTQAVTSTSGVEKSAMLKAADVQITGENGVKNVRAVAAGDPGELASVIRSQDALAPLSDSTLVISNETAQQTGMRTGDTVSMKTKSGSAVTATVKETNLDGDVSIVSQATLSKLSPDAVPGLMWARVDTDHAYDVVQDVQSKLTKAAAGADQETAVLAGPAMERAAYQSVVNTVLKVVIALLAISVVIALIGVANTLSLSVIERKRESAMLRALGLTRGQLRGMLAIEGVMIAAAGALIGVVCGVLYGWAGSAILLVSMTDVPLVVPWAHIGAIVAVALVAGLLASVIPARSAAKVAPAQALALE